jgi:hypothetical protein
MPLCWSLPVQEVLTGAVVPTVRPTSNRLTGGVTTGGTVSTENVRSIGVDHVPSPVCHWRYRVCGPSCSEPPREGRVRLANR